MWKDHPESSEKTTNLAGDMGSEPLSPVALFKFGDSKSYSSSSAPSTPTTKALARRLLDADGKQLSVCSSNSFMNYELTPNLACFIALFIFLVT